MKKVSLLIFLLFVVSGLYSKTLVTRESNIYFDTRGYADYFVSFGFGKSNAEPIKETTIEFSKPAITKDSTIAPAGIQFDAFWNITSESKIELSIEMEGPLKNGDNKIDWELEVTGDGKDFSIKSNEEKSHVLHTHEATTSAIQTNDSGSVDLRAYTSFDYKTVPFLRYTAVLKLKVTAI